MTARQAEPTPDDPIRRATEAVRPVNWVRGGRLREAATLIERNQLPAAAKLIQDSLAQHPADPGALYLASEVASRQGRIGDAEKFLERALAIAPDLLPARFQLAHLMILAGKVSRAIEEADRLVAEEPGNPLFRRSKAIALESMEDFMAAAVVWRGLSAEFPARPDIWMRFGHARRAVGAAGEAIDAYRKAVSLVPSFGEPWWALADMKTYRFEDAEIEAMERQIARPDLAQPDRTNILFALGKAYGDRQQFEKSFSTYARANALHRQTIRHDPDALTGYVARCKKLFTAEFFRERAGFGCDSTAPIFIVGLARSGSTLLEQILASHPDIEATRELRNIAVLSLHIQGEFAAKRGLQYPEVLQTLEPDELKALGERYLDNVRIHRKSGRPFFTDKMGANFVHVGLISLIFPHAKIIDARRHPLAAGFSIFAQHFVKGENDAYRLADIGKHTRNYVELMAHFERVLPRKIHRVAYEALVDEPEREIRALLDYLGLPFAQGCIEFHKTERVVTTASSEQVRRPLHANARDYWRNYEPWLGPLKSALGPVLDAYPDMPEFGP